MRQSTSNKKGTIICWNTGIDDILINSGKVAGIPLQMSIWVRMFMAHNWEVYCITNRVDERTINGISFFGIQTSAIMGKMHLSFLHELIQYIRIFAKYRPDISVERGATHKLLVLSVLCRLFNCKFIFFGASDNDFIPGKEYVAKRYFDMIRYHIGLRSMHFFVTQNSSQQKLLKNNYGKNSLIIPNISILKINDCTRKSYDAIWVSNMWPIKRAELFLQLASENQEKKFAIVGGAIDNQYYHSIEEKSKSIANITFCGPKSFDEVTRLMSESKLLVCTSEFEGFPNTFLQAWSQKVPILSTVNPNNVFDCYHVGYYVEAFEDLNKRFQQLIYDERSYTDMKHSIKDYFTENHSAESGYAKLTQFFNI